jgi:hypothetical protein
MQVKITNLHYRHLHTEAPCPVCGELTGSDHGGGYAKDLEPVCRFWCEEHGDFECKVDWGELLNRFINASD